MRGAAPASTGTPKPLLTQAQRPPLPGASVPLGCPRTQAGPCLPPTQTFPHPVLLTDGGVDIEGRPAPAPHGLRRNRAAVWAGRCAPASGSPGHLPPPGTGHRSLGGRRAACTLRDGLETPTPARRAAAAAGPAGPALTPRREGSRNLASACP